MFYPLSQVTKCCFLLLLNSAELAEFHSPPTPLGTMVNMELNLIFSEDWRTVAPQGGAERGKVQQLCLESHPLRHSEFPSGRPSAQRLWLWV